MKCGQKIIVKLLLKDIDFRYCPAMQSMHEMHSDDINSAKLSFYTIRTLYLDSTYNETLLKYVPCDDAEIDKIIDCYTNEAKNKFNIDIIDDDCREFISDVVMILMKPVLMCR